MKFLFCLLLMGCNNAPNEFKLRMDDSVQLYVNSWFMDCRKYLTVSQCKPKINLRVNVRTLPEGNLLGQCISYDNGDRIVDIIPQVVNSYNNWAVIYHELYHCVLDKPHYDADIDIMNAYENYDNTVKIYFDWENYVKKVFLRGD